MRLAQLTRSHEWWDHKTPQVLSLAYGTALLANTSLYTLLAPGFLMIFSSLIVMAIYASIINDFTDLEIDLACGKSNMMQRLRPAIRLLLVLLSLGLVIIAAVIFIYPNVYAVVFYLLIALSISIYSFKPIRLKNRGIWGVISCSAAEHLFPTLFAIAIIAFYSNFKTPVIWLCAAGALSLIYGIRSILWHQFLDRDNDIQSGMHTYATSTDPGSFNNKALTIILIELLAMATALFLLKLALPLIFLLFYILFIILRKNLFHSKIIVIISPKDEHFQILMLDYYAIFFPVSLLIYAAIKQPLAWVVLLVHLLLFHKMLIVTLKDGFYLLRSIYYKAWNT
ncbi:MAG: 4-hydroxybenzoate polyprenyltransferase [Mucilaginibacter sp.]|nr:4-hydroxybenzoate polyprenyltransferase [Mucilaginibacter sp.]